MQLRIWLFFLTLGMIYFGTATVQVLAYVDDSAHGSTTYGVDRLAGFAVANCAHCHEQHASVDGSEPPPVTNAQEYLLFDQSNTDQAANFCFDCHTSVSAYQQVTNRSYSYRAGGWNGSPVTNIKAAFGQASSHQLSDIVDFAALPARGWKYKAVVHGDPADSNACAVCHDPHVVKGDPADAPNTGKSGAARPGVITEINSSPINLWGDGAGEMMDPDYTINYQAPNCVTAGNEPACDGTANGTNLPNYVSFCTKCHDAATTLFGTKTLKVIDWANEIHGQINAVNIAMDEPYLSATGPFVLSCLDCHEPHGSVNLYLLRGAVNGTALTGAIASGVDFDKICRQCHNEAGGASDWDNVHHAGTDPVYLRGGTCDSAAGCHSSPAAARINCEICHFHGADTTVVGMPPDNPPGLRVTF